MWLIFALLLGNLLGEKKNKKPCLKVTTDLLPGEAFFGCAEAVEPGFPGSRRSVWQQQGVSCEALQDSWVAVRWQLEQKAAASFLREERETYNAWAGREHKERPAQLLTHSAQSTAHRNGLNPIPALSTLLMWVVICEARLELAF